MGSQLGIIIIILGLGNPILSFFHLISHAFFKAILFICAGIIIHNIKDYQDIRKIGFSFNNLNYSISIIIIANLSLCGLPFIRGFYFISENSIFILIRIFILLPFSIIGGIILSFNIIRSNKIFFYDFLEIYDFYLYL